MATLHIFIVVFLFATRCSFSKSKLLQGVIQSRYGNHVLKIIRKYEKLDYLTYKLSNDLKFLNNCLNHDRCSTFLKYKLLSKRLQNSETYKLSQSIFIQQCITFKILEIDKVCAYLNKMKDN